MPLGPFVGKDVRKHLNDVLRLSQLLAPATRIADNHQQLLGGFIPQSSQIRQ